MNLGDGLYDDGCSGVFLSTADSGEMLVVQGQQLKIQYILDDCVPMVT